MPFVSSLNASFGSSRNLAGVPPVIKCRKTLERPVATPTNCRSQYAMTLSDNAAPLPAQPTQILSCICSLQPAPLATATADLTDALSVKAPLHPRPA